MVFVTINMSRMKVRLFVLGLDDEENSRTSFLVFKI
jgi:hypothetical protein